jgi:kinesin family protein C2/C3
LALERKETELEQWKSGNARNAMESQKPRAASPFRMPKYGTTGSVKPENSQRSIDDRSSEVIEYIYVKVIIG